MSEINEIKNRIKGVAATQKITNALYLISSAKVRKAREELEKTSPYFRGIRKESGFQKKRSKSSPARCWERAASTAIWSEAK